MSVDESPAIRRSSQVRWKRVVPMAVVFFAINLVAFFYNLICLVLLGMWATLMPRRRQLVVDALAAMSIAVVLYLGLALANPHW